MFLLKEVSKRFESSSLLKPLVYSQESMVLLRIERISLYLYDNEIAFIFQEKLKERRLSYLNQIAISLSTASSESEA